MQRFHIFNPAAGKGNSPSILQKGSLHEEETHITTCCGDAEETVFRRCLEAPDTHFIIYGGDGTFNEAVNGVLRAGAGQTALLSLIPTGSGNDFVRSFPEKTEKPVLCDAILCSGLPRGSRYAVNIVNLGFDCNAAYRMNAYKNKPLVSGSMAYILGVGDVLCHPLGEHWRFTFTDEDGNEDSREEECLLLLIANGRYYGGGFLSAPLAVLTDGLLDVVWVKKVPRGYFISMVGDYKKGKHLDPEKNAVAEKFRDSVFFRRCRKVRIEGLTRICQDGEISEGSTLTAEVVPKAFRFLPL